MRTAIWNALARGLACAMLSTSIGCSESDEQPPARIAAPLTVPVPTLNQFVVLATRSVSFGDRSTISGGDIGVGPGANATTNTLTSGMDSRVGIGEVLLAQRVVLRERAITGEIGANFIDAPAATTGPRSAFVAPPAPPIPGSFSAGTTAVNVNLGQISTLAAGRFGAVTVSGTLNLSGGLYEIQSLRINPEARVTALAASTVRVTGGVALADRSRLVVGPGLNAGAFRLLVAGNIDTNNNSVSAFTDVQLGALVVARNAFRSGDRLVANGSIAAADVIIGNDARVTFSTGFACSSNAGCNDANPCTVDTCVDTRCTHSAAANGTTCNDGNACTRTDSCQAGACVGANPLSCTALDQCHVPGTCNPATGQCSNPEKANGAACNDGSACTRSDACQAGACVGNDPVVCSALDQCHDPGTCNPATGACSNPDKPNGAACSDGNLCTSTDTCQAGSCRGDNPVVCTAIDDCHDAGVCDPASGACSAPVRADGSLCNDGNACTRADACQTGSCVGADPVLCAALDQCHDAGVCDPASGVCSDPPKPDGTRCDDDEACTHGDICRAGACAPGTELAVSEFATGSSRPGWIVSGPLDSLWFLSPESSFGANDGSLGQITPSGVVTRTALGRNVYSLLFGSDGLLWMGDTVPGGLPTIGRYSVTTASFVSDFIGLQPQDMVMTNDGGNPIVWFTGGSAVGRVTPAGVVLAPVRTFNATRAIAAAATTPSTLWFTQANTGTGRSFIGRIQFPNLVQFAIETPGELADITEGPDGRIWFTDAGRNEIARIAPNGTALARFPLRESGSSPYSIVPGPDGNLWSTLRAANKVLRVSTAGEMTEICIPTANSDPTQIAVGPDGNMWFTQRNSGNVARIELSP